MADIDVIKENVQFEQLIKEDNTNCVLKEEYLIPDTHPDVQEILTIQSKPFITSKETVGDKIMLEGKVEYTVLYLAREDNMIINSVDYMQKFNTTIDLNQGEHRVICEVECNVEHIEAAIMNERKISIQGIIAINFELYKSSEFEFVKDIEGAKDIEVLKKTETINRLTSTNKMELNGKSMIRVGMDKPQIDKILNCGLMLHKKEIKLAEDKVYVGCYCKVNILYKGYDTNDIISLDDDIYLSKEEETAGVNADMIPLVSFELCNNDLMLEEDDLGEVRIINTEVLVNANTKIFSKEKIDVVKDAYSPDCLLDLKKEEYNVGVIEGCNSTESIIKDNIQLTDMNLKPEEILEKDAVIILTDKEVKKDKVIVEGLIKANVLYKTTDEEKCAQDVKSEIPFSAMIDIDGADEGMKSIVKANLENLEAYIEGNTIAIKANIILSGKILYELKKQFISEVVEDDGEKPNKKASITIYVIGDNDTLWNLAKKYSTTVESLMKLNGIESEGDVQKGQKIIIPGRAIF